MSRTLVVLQPNYIPWRGYFDQMMAADVCVIYDTAKYTKQDWRNRNRLKTPRGVKWLTLPVPKKSTRLPINEVRACDPDWRAQHLRVWSHLYAQAPEAEAMLPRIRQAYEQCPPDHLVSICMHFIEMVRRALGIDTPLLLASDLLADGGAEGLDASERLVHLCQRLDCDRYLTGPAASNYLQEGCFSAASIEVEWFSYPAYGEYDQPHPPFAPAVSILDLLLCTGERAREHLAFTPDGFRSGEDRGAVSTAPSLTA